MDAEQLKSLLSAVRSGDIEIGVAFERFRDLPFDDQGFAKIDHHRAIRKGFPEVVFCQGKTVDQVKSIVERLLLHHDTVLATRATPEMYQAVREVAPDAQYDQLGRCIVVRPAHPRPAIGSVVLASAGTADLPVAEEAGITAELMGSRVDRIYDVGVAGLHRLLAHRDRFLSANVVIVVAGMDGALPSVVAGLVSCPVIAVPTSVGYGASFGGLAALLNMLNSCAPGLAVVNIDNGFGAGFLAHTINRQSCNARDDDVYD